MYDELHRVIKLMQEKFPDAVDYNVIADGRDRINYAELLNADGLRVGVISAEQLDDYWNRMEDAI